MSFIDNDDPTIETQYVKISLNEFPGKLAVISRLKKETFVTGTKGELIKSHVIPQCTVNIQEGSVKPATMLELQVRGYWYQTFLSKYNIHTWNYT